MRVALRVDSSLQSGSGHLMRCMVLAKSLQSAGAEVCFFCRDPEGGIDIRLAREGFRCVNLKQQPGWQPPGHLYEDWLECSVEWDAAAFVEAALSVAAGQVFDWIVVDHYALDVRWESTVREVGRKIMVIDDLANRPHDCDLLLDQNYCADMRTRYHKLVPDNCVTLLGPTYALLREEFYRLKPGSFPRDTLLVFFGGYDRDNMTSRVLPAIAAAAGDSKVVLVVSEANPHREALAGEARGLAGVELRCQVDNMAELLARSWLTLGAGGGFIWERLRMRAPSITYSTAANQTAALQALASDGYLTFLGEARDFKAEELENSLREHLAGVHRYKEFPFNEQRDFLWQQLQDA